MIILEGPNGCGKSTIALTLHRALDWPIYKFPTPRDPTDAVRNLDSLETAPHNIILDRHPMISDRIYAPITFPEIDPIPWRPEALEGHTLVYCKCPIGTAIKRHKYVKHDPFYRNELRIFAGYDALLETVPHLVWNWVNDTEKEMIALIKRSIADDR